MYRKFEELLKLHDITAYKVGKATKIPLSTFTNWKQGVSSPKVDKLAKIAAYFNVPIEYFLNKDQKGA